MIETCCLFFKTILLEQQQTAVGMKKTFVSLLQSGSSTFLHESFISLWFGKLYW